MVNNEYMTVPAMMSYMCVSKKTAYRLLTDGKIPAYRPSARKTLVKRADVDKYICCHKL